MAICTPLVTSLLLLVLLSACEQSAASPVAPFPSALPPTPAPSAIPPSPGRGASLLEGMRQRLARCRGIETELTSDGQGTWDDGVDKGRTRTNHNRARLQWSKPSRLHGEMLEAPFALMVGGTLDTTDGLTLTLRPRGLLSVVAMKVASTDVKLRNSRNHTFRDSHPAAQLQRLAAPGAAWTVLSEGPGTLTVEVSGVRRLDAGIAQEVLVVGAGDLAPRTLTMLEAGRAVVKNTYKDFRWKE